MKDFARLLEKYFNNKSTPEKLPVIGHLGLANAKE